MPLTARIRRSPLARGLFALLLFCALAIRVAIPTGFMPTQTSQGIVISLCTGHGPAKAYLPIEKTSSHDGHHGTAGAPCAFAAGLGGPLVEPGVPVFKLVPPIAFPLLLVRAIADLTVHRLAAPPPPSHAPPVRS